MDESSAIATAANESKGGGTRKIVAWTIYDWANSSFTTIVVSFIYSGFFTQVMVRDDVLGQALWGRAVSVSALFIAVISPIVGAMADRGGKRRYYLFVSTMVCVVATALLTFVAPDTPNAVLIALSVNGLRQPPSSEEILDLPDAHHRFSGLPDLVEEGRFWRAQGEILSIRGSSVVPRSTLEGSGDHPAHGVFPAQLIPRHLADPIELLQSEYLLVGGDLKYAVR